jgi:hypothetical protein
MSLSLFERAIAYKDGAKIISSWLGSGGVPVEKEQAQRRADTCIKCPMNDEGWKAPEAVAAAIKEQIELKNNLDMRVTGEKSLATCSACLCANKLKVWTPLSFLTKYMKQGDVERYHKGCWVRSELQ